MRKILFFSILASLVVMSGCHHRERDQVKGSGIREKQKREVASFTSITTEGEFDIEVVCQKDLSLELEGDDNILPLVSAEVSNNILQIKNLDTYSDNSPIIVRIAVPNIEAISVTGAGKFVITGLKNDKFEIDLEGAPNINVSGITKLIDINSVGAGKIDAHNLTAARAVVESKGVCKIDLDVAEQLDVTVAGPSSVTYQGNPVVNKTITGPGKVERREKEGA